jgi:hypothetical protein
MQPIGGVAFGSVDDTAVRKLVMQWEHAASGIDTRTLFLNARDDVAQVLTDLVKDDARALAVAPLTLVIIAGEAILNMTISGTPAEPVITAELWPARLPAIMVTMVERFESPGKPDSPRQRTWTFTPADAQPITVSHRRVAAPFPRRVGARRIRSVDCREGGLALPVYYPTAVLGCLVVEPVFISSLARDEMGAIRASAKAAVESLQMRPVMFETAPASRDDSRRALLDELGGCDVVVLLLGAEYGERTERGVSATEDEFNEAVRRGIPVVALVQEVARSAEQDEFVSRVRGTWSEGRFAPEFRRRRRWLRGRPRTERLAAARRDQREPECSAGACPLARVGVGAGRAEPHGCEGARRDRADLEPADHGRRHARRGARSSRVRRQGSRIARREDVESPELVTHLVAEVRHAFLLDGRALTHCRRPIG